MRKKLNKNKYIVGSLFHLALVSFFFVTLPLLFAIFYTLNEVDTYNKKSQKTLFLTVELIESSRIIVERLISMERGIRQFQVLKEPDQFGSYLEHREKLTLEIQSLKKKSIGNKLLKKIITLEQNENNLFQFILNSTNQSPINFTQKDLNAFDSLSTLAQSILSEGQNKGAKEAIALSSSAERVGNNLIFLALTCIALAFIFGLVFIYLLTRPIKAIALAIQHLGDAGFDQPISVKGPKDLAELGVHLEWLRQNLNKIEHEKQQFIRNISHELKTPLATLKEGTDLLADNVVGELNTEQYEIIQLMSMSNITINDLVENLLEYQRVASTVIEFNPTTFRLDVLIERISNEYQLLLRSKNINLNNKLEAIDIRADYDKIKIIMSNLFSNALKFSPKNGTIGLTLSTHDNIIQFFIEDQGQGIKKEIQPYIFKDFYQGNSPVGWKIKATGLGLALVKYYLEAHHGTIRLLSSNKDYCGARFSLVLPQHKKP